MDTKKRNLIIICSVSAAIIAICITVIVLVAVLPKGPKLINPKIVVFDNNLGIEYDKTAEGNTPDSGIFTYTYDRRPHAPDFKVVDQRTGKELDLKDCVRIVIYDMTEGQKQIADYPVEKGRYSIYYDFQNFDAEDKFENTEFQYFWTNATIIIQ